MIGIIYLLFIVATLASMWVLFTKAGKPGWAALVPIYNMIVLLEIVKKPMWWFLLMLVPLLNLIVAFRIFERLSKSFGKEGIGFVVGLLLLAPVFYAILAFTDAQYDGSAISDDTNEKGLNLGF